MDGADSMMVNVLVVVGLNMVGTNSWEKLHFRLSKKLQSLKIADSGATPDPLP